MSKLDDARRQREARYMASTVKAEREILVPKHPPSIQMAEMQDPKNFELVHPVVTTRDRGKYNAYQRQYQKEHRDKRRNRIRELEAEVAALRSRVAELEGDK